MSLDQDRTYRIERVSRLPAPIGDKSFRSGSASRTDRGDSQTLGRSNNNEVLYPRTRRCSPWSIGEACNEDQKSAIGLDDNRCSSGCFGRWPIVIQNGIRLTYWA